MRVKKPWGWLKPMEQEIIAMFRSGDTTKRIAKKIGCSQAAIWRLLKRNDIKMTRTNYRAGGRHKYQDGYIGVLCWGHPHATVDGYVMEHILVMERLIKRHLRDDECVHHENHIKDDNRPENLRLMAKSAHMALHARDRARGYDPVSGKYVFVGSVREKFVPSPPLGSDDVQCGMCLSVYRGMKCPNCGKERFGFQC